MSNKTISERVTTLESVIPEIRSDIRDMKENHLNTIEADIKEMTKVMGSMKGDSIEVKNDVAWLKRFFWIIATASIGSLVAQLVTFIKK